MSNEDIVDASKNGNIKRIKYLIERERVDVNSKDEVKNKIKFLI